MLPGRYRGVGEPTLPLPAVKGPGHPLMSTRETDAAPHPCAAAGGSSPCWAAPCWHGSRCEIPSRAGAGAACSERRWGWSGVGSLSPLCRTIEPEALKQGNMSSLGFTSKEQRNLGLLVHLMTSNPKILYAPVGTEVDKVILKVRVQSPGPPSFLLPPAPLRWDLLAQMGSAGPGLSGEEGASCQPALPEAGSCPDPCWGSDACCEVGRDLCGCQPSQRVGGCPCLFPLRDLPPPRPTRPSPLWATSPTTPRRG